MGWAEHHIKKLQSGEVVTFRPRGNSMTPRVKSGALVTVEPITDFSTIKLGDIVLCKVSGAEYLHLVKGIREREGIPFLMIGNNKGGINGWTPQRHVYGKCTRVEP